MTTPHRFRESAFRKYEHVIAMAVDSFPKPYIVDPDMFKLSQATFSCRLRDAMNAAHDNHWGSKLVNLAKFYEVHRQMQVSERPDGLIAIGAKEHLKDVATTPLVAPSLTAQAAIDFTIDNIGDATVLGNLAAKRALAAPLRLLALSPALADYLSANFDVELTKEPDGSYILI